MKTSDDVARANEHASSDAAPARRLTAQDFHPAVLRLFDQYVHGLIDRRGFLERAAQFAAAGTSALVLLEALSPNFAQAQQVPPTDARLQIDSAE
ncbi:MAG: hypothetical protein ABUL77_00880, partial [Bacteroidota bacterium]